MANKHTYSLVFLVALCLMTQAGLASASEITGSLSNTNGNEATASANNQPTMQFSVVSPNSNFPSNLSTNMKVILVGGTVLAAIIVLSLPYFRKKKQPLNMVKQ